MLLQDTENHLINDFVVTVMKINYPLCYCCRCVVAAVSETSFFICIGMERKAIQYRHQNLFLGVDRRKAGVLNN